jgi:hypothetical protein
MAKALDLPSDVLFHLLSEVILGVPESRSTVPPSRKVAEARAQLVESVAAVRAEGFVPDVPHE